MMASEPPFKLFFQRRAAAWQVMCQIDIFPAVDVFLEAQPGIEPEGKAIVIEMEGLGAAHLSAVARGGVAGDVEIADYASVVGGKCIWR